MWTLDTYLKVVSHVGHAALHKYLTGLFLQGLSTNIQCMDINQVIDTTDLNPIPGANLRVRHIHRPVRHTVFTLLQHFLIPAIYLMVL